MPVSEGPDKLLAELLPWGAALADGAGRVAAANSAARVLLGLNGQGAEAADLTRSGRPTSLAEVLREHAAGPTLRRRVDVEHPENGRLRLTLTRVTETDLRFPIAGFRLEEQTPLPAFRPEPHQIEQSQIENQESKIFPSWVHVVVERAPQRDWRWARHSDPLVVFAHELNNVLTSLREGVALLKDGAGGPVTEVQRHLLEGVSDDAARITRLTSTMLAASGARAGRVRVAEGWVSARELTARVFRSFEAPARRAGVDLCFGEVGADLGCHGDSDLLTQALSNLVGNAMKFTPRGGRVSVTARQGEAGGEPVFELAVRDTGQGLSQDDIERVLGRGPADAEPPEQDARSGLGIGLTIVREIIEEHGGRLVAEGEPGVGCCFRLVVPQDFRRGEPRRLRQIANGLRLARAVAVPLSVVEIRVACPDGADWASGSGLVHLPLIEHCLEESLRPSDTVMVFESSATLVLYDVDGGGARRVANRAVRALARLFARLPQPYPQSVIGWGVASYPAEGTAAPALADAACRDMETLLADAPADREPVLAAAASGDTCLEGSHP